MINLLARQSYILYCFTCYGTENDDKPRGGAVIFIDSVVGNRLTNNPLIEPVVEERKG